MKFTVSDAAHHFVTTEMGLSEGSGLNFTSKVYGSTAIHEGLSVAIHVEQPHGDILAETTKDGVTYYLLKSDDWFFADHDFSVDFDTENETFIYHFTKN